MLVLSRFKNESIIIGEDVVVTLVDLRHDKARIGVSAPDWMAVHRLEIAESIYREALARGENPPPVPVLRRRGGAA